MPYRIKKEKKGFKVCKKTGNKCFSKKPLTKTKAKKQLAAIKINESISSFKQFFLKYC